ncbi:SAM and SH3 domain-containing protein 3 [Caerostris extrusa]|uniref:SAM and SH3 domain-containing protein 3 n=1 Tax=Caerostris extrusa TaxID=172846 RepID=A0AAV4Q8P7_CAEEX|nr:SAM and SH3 domain-containing protein 3 [Caerostris extrusa]
MIDILAKSSSGYWVGKLRNQIGHFKFINVEEIPNGDRKVSKRRLSSFEQAPKSNVAKTLEDLLEHLGLEGWVRNISCQKTPSIDFDGESLISILGKVFA